MDLKHCLVLQHLNPSFILVHGLGPFTHIETLIGVVSGPHASDEEFKIGPFLFIRQRGPVNFTLCVE
jgi:hypothetical protein